MYNSLDTTIPSCPSNLLVYAGADGVNVTWQQPSSNPPVTSTTVTYCPTSSPNCGSFITCTSSPCAISGLDSGTEYQFTVISNNYCGSAIGCTENNATAETTCEYSNLTYVLELFVVFIDLMYIQYTYVHCRD